MSLEGFFHNVYYRCTLNKGEFVAMSYISVHNTVQYWVGVVWLLLLGGCRCLGLNAGAAFHTVQTCDVFALWHLECAAAYSSGYQNGLLCAHALSATCAALGMMYQHLSALCRQRLMVPPVLLIGRQVLPLD
jgi:hypothetical protein